MPRSATGSRSVLPFISPAGLDDEKSSSSPTPRRESRGFTAIASGSRETWACIDRNADGTLGLSVLQLGSSRDGALHDRVLISDSPESMIRTRSRLVPYVRIPGSFVLEGASRRLGRKVETLSLHPLVDLTKGPGKAFGRLVVFVARELERPEGLGRPMERLTRAVAEALLELQPYQVRYETERPDAERNDGPRVVRRVDELIKNHLGEELNVQTIADHAGVSARTLFRNYRRYRGRSPLQALREARLAKVRDALQTASPGESVTRAATRCGFNHLGRFSEIYRRAYGERPSDTLRRARASSIGNAR